MSDDIHQVLILGSGLIGGSIALALKRVQIDVVLDDIDAEQVAVAQARGGGRPLAPGDTPDIVIVAVPPQEAPIALARMSERFPMATITDVTSVKSPILRAALAAGADAQRLIGGHPMAGREVSGAAAARADLLDDRIWIITPGSEVLAEHVRRVKRLIELCGAFPVVMDPAAHDDAVALVSHTPQILSSLLAGLLVNAPDEHVQIAGQGLRDMTRIADSNPDLWTEILATNAAPVGVVLQGLAEQLQIMANALLEAPSKQSEGRIHQMLQSGVQGRSRVPGRHGTSARAEAVTTVMIADRPGELARLFTAAGQAGINLDDVRIEHVLGRPSGLVELVVQPESLELLHRVLMSEGFDLRT